MHCKAKGGTTHSVKYVNEGFVNQERLKEDGDDGCTLAKYQEGSIHPCEGFPIEYRKECDLGEVCPEEEIDENDDGKNHAR